VNDLKVETRSFGKKCGAIVGGIRGGAGPGILENTKQRGEKGGFKTLCQGPEPEVGVTPKD